MLFTRDLRVHDNPALVAACAAARRLVPLFVLDEVLLAGRTGTPNKVRFLLDSLADLRDSLRRRGSDLVLRFGDPVTETVRVAEATGAGGVFMAADVGPYAGRRAARLAGACASRRLALSSHPGVTAVPPGALTPAGGDHYRVFTPYWRAWCEAPLRAVEPAPARLPPLPPELGDPAARTDVSGGAGAGRGAAAVIVEAGAALPRHLARLVPGTASPWLPPGGETAARGRMRTWLAGSLAGYAEHHDDLTRGVYGGVYGGACDGMNGGVNGANDGMNGDADGTSRLSPYLRFGCLSPLELYTAAGRVPGAGAGADAFRRQLAWRDFHHQVTAAFPEIGRLDYRPRGDRWVADPDALDAWREGRTGVPIVDAGMRQLMREGWMHNRARLITASYLTRRLRIDWRLGLRHFGDLLVDADLADNAGNWQWVAGTGNDTRPGRVLNPLRQAERFDPDGAYVLAHVPELGALEGRRAHRPWELPADVRRALDYPSPLTVLG